MSTLFYLQTDGNREVIGEEMLSGFRMIHAVHAPDWLHAKRDLGYELTSFQELLLPLSPAARGQEVGRSKWEGLYGLLSRELRDANAWRMNWSKT